MPKLAPLRPGLVRLAIFFNQNTSLLHKAMASDDDDYDVEGDGDGKDC